MTIPPPSAPSRLGAAALLREVTVGLVQRPGRSALTALGTVLGVGTLVAILGLTATARDQVSERFTVLTATTVVIEQRPTAGEDETGGEPYVAFPPDSSERVMDINGVRSAGVWWPARPGARVSAGAPGLDASRGEDLAVYAADAGVIAASRPTWLEGRSYNEFHAQRAEAVAVLGATAARNLGVGRLGRQPAVFVDGRAFTVVGIIGALDLNKELLASVLIPTATAQRTWGLPKEVAPQMSVETELGAAAQVARQVPVALRPDHPEYFSAIAPPDPRSLARQVSGDLDGLFLILALVSLVIGTFGIANTTLVSVLERVPEIGLRRALGAHPRHIGVQFLAESAALGAVGGVIGTTLGVAVILTVAVTHEWTPVMPGWLGASPILGAATGLIAGLFPAWRATRVEPAEALRR